MREERDGRGEVMAEEIEQVKARMVVWLSLVMV
jgi:hypothetical protein